MPKIERTQIQTLNDFMEWIQQLVSGEYLFRGISNEEYEIEASAYRRLANKEDKNLEKLLEINRSLIKDARLHGHNYRNGTELSELEILAELQHFRVATCLIDFTYNAQVALWFACQPDSKNSPNSGESSNGKVVAVRNNPDGLKEITPELLSKDTKIDYFFEEDKDGQYPLYQWQPRQLNNRIVPQHSVFLFGGAKIEEAAECIIIESSKQAILTALQRVSAITEATLFPDFDGFTRLRSHNVPYTQFNTADYKERGSRAYQRREYEDAITDYDMVISLNPDDAEAYYLRGLAKGNLAQYESAIADFNEAIQLDSRYVRAYANRGLARYRLGQYEETIANFDSVIALNLEDAHAYYWRGLAKKNIDRFDEAKIDLRKALQLARLVSDETLIAESEQLIDEIESHTESRFQYEQTLLR